MLVLAMDTSTAVTSAAVVGDGDGGGGSDGGSGSGGGDGGSDGGGVRSSVAVAGANRHGEVLAPALRQALSEAGVAVGDLSHVAVGVGPGPFTGLRVGLATASAMAHALGIPCVGVGSLDALAAANGSGELVAVTDARRREVYWARYAAGRRVDGPAVGRPGDVAEALRGSGAEVLRGSGADALRGSGADALRGFDGLVVGAGAVLHADAFAGWTVEDGVPEARWVGRLAVEGRTLPVVPLYLRRPDAVEPGAAKAVLR